MSDPRDLAKLIARGTARALAQRSYASLSEVPLANGRRADLVALARDGMFLIVEVKSSVADFRSDRKWADYREFCDRLSFAVPAEFPAGLIPEDCGLIVADPFGATILREGGGDSRLGAARRKALTLRFSPPARRQPLAAPCLVPIPARWRRSRIDHDMLEFGRASFDYAALRSGRGASLMPSAIFLTLSGAQRSRTGAPMPMPRCYPST